jgi:protein TonB
MTSVKPSLISLLIHALVLGTLAVGPNWLPLAAQSELPQIEIESGFASVASVAAVSSTAAMVIEEFLPPKFVVEPPRTPATLPVERGESREPRPEMIVELQPISRPRESLAESPLPSIPRTKPVDPIVLAKVAPAAAVSSEASVASNEASGSQVDAMPRLLPTNPAPAYPANALAMRLEGLVELLVLVGVNGRAEGVTLYRSSGSDVLDQAAINTVRNLWSFQPAMVGDRPVAFTVVVPIRFRIRSAS